MSSAAPRAALFCPPFTPQRTRFAADVLKSPPRMSCSMVSRATNAPGGPEAIAPRVLPDPERRLRTLYELADRVARARGVDDVVEATLEAVLSTGLAERASVLLFDRDAVMRFKASRGLSEEYRRAVEGHTPWRPDTPDPKPIVVPDVHADAGLAPYRPVFDKEGIRALGFVPLAQDGRVLGKFMLYHREPHVFPDEEILLAQTIAGHVSNALARNAAEAELRVQALVLENMAEGVSIADPAGVIVYTNPSEDAMFGCARGELVGKPMRARLAQPPEGAERAVAQVLARLRAEGRWEGEWENARKDGSRFVAHARMSTLEIRGETHFVCVQQDISDRRSVEDALRQSEQRFRVLADIVPQLVFTTTREGAPDYYNERWYDYTGLPRDGPDEAWTRALHPEDAPVAERAWREAVTTGRPYEIQYRIRRASDGAYRWHLGRATPMRDADGGIVRWFGTCTDIHDQKLAEEALRESEERFRSLSNSSPVGIFLALTTGEAQYTNPACDRICGFEGDAPGFGWAERIHPEDRERVLREWMAYAGDGRSTYASEFRWRHKDGTVRLTTVRAAPLLRNGALVGHVGTVEDITDARRAADELERTRAQLTHNEKLSALGSLVGGVAHELRTPLTYLSNNLSIIERNLERALAELDPSRSEPLRAKLTPCMSDARESIERIDRLVEDLRKYTRLRAGEPKTPLPLDGVVREAVDLFRAARRGRVHVAAELGGTAPVRVDRVQVQQIVINLLENAADARPRDATVRIATRAEPDGGATLLVADRGEGIPPDLLARIWDPFFTTKPEGSGLGLAIVRRIVEEHHGRIDVTSTPGEGTTFAIRFPPA